MAEIVNLRRARKAKVRSNAEAEAYANRIAHGRTKAEKQHTAAEQALSIKRMDGLRLDGEKRPADADTAPAQGRDPNT